MKDLSQSKRGFMHIGTVETHDSQHKAILIEFTFWVKDSFTWHITFSMLSQSHIPINTFYMYS